MKLKRNGMNTMKYGVLLAFLMNLAGSHGRLAAPRREDKSEEKLRRQVAKEQKQWRRHVAEEQQDRPLNVIAVLWEDCFLPDFVDKLEYFEAELQVVLHRTNSLALKIPARNLQLLELDTCTMVVEEDSEVVSMASDEVIPWGLPLMLPDPASVPLPPQNEPCFKICVIDSGFMVDHPDLVSRRG